MVFVVKLIGDIDVLVLIQVIEQFIVFVGEVMYYCWVDVIFEIFYLCYEVGMCIMLVQEQWFVIVCSQLQLVFECMVLGWVW